MQRVYSWDGNKGRLSKHSTQMSMRRYRPRKCRLIKHDKLGRQLHIQNYFMSFNFKTHIKMQSIFVYASVIQIYLFVWLIKYANILNVDWNVRLNFDWICYWLRLNLFPFTIYCLFICHLYMEILFFCVRQTSFKANLDDKTKD